METNREERLKINPMSGSPVDLLLEPFTTTSGSNGAYWSVFDDLNGPTTATWAG